MYGAPEGRGAHHLSVEEFLAENFVDPVRTLLHHHAGGVGLPQRVQAQVEFRFRHLAFLGVYANLNLFITHAERSEPYNAANNIRPATSRSNPPKHRFSVGAGMRWLSATPTGASSTVNNAIKTTAGR